MSEIVTIYQNLGGVTILYNGQAPRVLGLDATPDRLERAHLPARIILPQRAPDAPFAFVAFGSMATVAWTILDLLCIKPVGQGTGVLDVSTALIGYTGAYLEQMRRFRDAGIPGGTAWLEQVRIDPGIYEYPQQSGAWYHGALATLIIHEELSG